MIYGANPRAQYLAYKSEIDAAVLQVLDQGQYILGAQVTSFEEEFAHWNQVQECVGVANGTDALQLALRALEVTTGDEVILPSHTAVATAAAVISVGASPVFADIDDFFCISADSVRALISSKTKAVIAVHLYGNPAHLDDLVELVTEHKIPLIEDCAQAHGARYHNERVGSRGALSCFSFYPTKNLGAIGDGGAVITQDASLANRIKELRQYGWKRRYISDVIGFNSRLDELQAAILRVKLRHLDQMNQRRQAIAELYHDRLSRLSAHLTLPSVRPECEHVFHLYVARTTRRDELIAYAEEHSVKLGIHYPKPVHQQRAYADCMRGDLSRTELIANEIISLPMYPELPDKHIEQVIDVIHSFYTST